MKILLDSKPTDGNGHPAADAVLNGAVTEADLRKLQTELADERGRHAITAKEKKTRETKIAELEDELGQLRRLQSAQPVPAKIPANVAAVKPASGWHPIISDESD